MAVQAKLRRDKRIKRQARVRKQISGTDSRPRLCVYRSLRYTYGQLISDDSNAVIVSVSSRDIEVKDASRKGIDTAKAVGRKLAELAKEKKIKQIVFDRNGYVYHGRVAAVAEGAREAGLEF